MVGKAWRTVKNWMSSEQKVIIKNPNRSSILENVIEDYKGNAQSKITPKTKDNTPKLENNVNPSQPQTETGSVLLEFSEDEVQLILDNFKGERLEMDRNQLQEFVKSELSVQKPANPNLYSQLLSLLNLGRGESVESDEWVSASIVLKDTSSDDPKITENPLVNDKNGEVIVKKLDGFSLVRLEESYAPLSVKNITDTKDEWMDVSL